MLKTAEGANILASGGRDLTGAQAALAEEGELVARANGLHAEATAIQAAQESGLTPSAMAVSRMICPACQALIEDAGGAVLPGGRGAVW